MDDDISVMIVGSGAREHAISKAYEKSHLVDRIIVAPGNDFIGYNRVKDVIVNKNCSLKNPESILDIAKKYNPVLVDVTQDDALALGTVDLLEENGFLVFGPGKNEARIEWDKWWSREFMKKYEIPIPDSVYFDSEERGIRYVKYLYEEDPNKALCLYIKASGLCAGKGALLARNLDEAIRCIEKMKDFGDAGKIFLVEDCLIGKEFSYFSICDGEIYRSFKPAQDYKRIFNNDLGLQTGGMGSICPATMDEDIINGINSKLISRALNGMREEDLHYKGILYLGGIITNKGVYTIEYNSRWGDPECQVVLPGLESDYFSLVMGALTRKLGYVNISFDDKSRVCVVGTSKGYPEDYSGVIGKRIYGLEEVMIMKGITVFGAGIKINKGKFYVSGGRLFNIVAEGNNIEEARKRAYEAILCVSVEGDNLHYRTDIGLDKSK